MIYNDADVVLLEDQYADLTARHPGLAIVLLFHCEGVCADRAAQLGVLSSTETRVCCIECACSSAGVTSQSHPSLVLCTRSGTRVVDALRSYSEQPTTTLFGGRLVAQRHEYVNTQAAPAVVKSAWEHVTAELPG